MGGNVNEQQSNRQLEEMTTETISRYHYYTFCFSRSNKHCLIASSFEHIAEVFINGVLNPKNQKKIPQ